jgi:protein-S-isoprenylcysteine O-methyltransferase Ste14
MNGTIAKKRCGSCGVDAKQWRGVGLTTAVFISLFTISFFHPMFRLHEDHLWAHLLSRTGIMRFETSLYLMMVVSSSLIAVGLFIFSLGWKEIRRAEGELVTMGLYSIMRHPQLLGLILMVIAFLIGWPTLLPLLFVPHFIWRYVLLARQEDQELEKKFGEHFRRYKERVSAFIPSMTPHG